MGDGDSVLPPPLHQAAIIGSLPQVRELVCRTPVDQMWAGRTALWEAVMYGHPAVARFLVAAGADPERTQIAGWSAAGLAAAGPEPDLLGGARLDPDDQVLIARARQLTIALDEVPPNGSFACVSGIDELDATGRLRARPIAWAADLSRDESEHTVAVTDVPGGCVIAHPTGATAIHPAVLEPLTRGTAAYAVHEWSGVRFVDGRMTGGDLAPGSGHVEPGDTREDVLRAYLYRGRPLAYACEAAGLTPVDGRAFTGPPDKLLRLPPIRLRSPQPEWPARS